MTDGPNWVSEGTFAFRNSKSGFDWGFDLSLEWECDKGFGSDCIYMVSLSLSLRVQNQSSGEKLEQADEFVYLGKVFPKINGQV